MSETTDIRNSSEAGEPGDAGDAAPWLAATMPCVYCGRTIERSSQRCPQCKTSYSMAVRKASREVEGDWFYLEPRNPSNRGVDFRTMLKLIEKGRLRPDSIVRGPATHQDWMYAAEAPMLSKHLGNCPHCFGPATGNDEFCTTCGRHLDQIPGRLKSGLSSPTANVRFAAREQMEQSLAEALKTHELARTAAMVAVATPAAASAGMREQMPVAESGPGANLERSSVAASAGRQQRDRHERRRPKPAIVALLTVVTLIPLALAATYIPWYGIFFWSDADQPGTLANNVRSNQDSIKSSLAGFFGGGGSNRDVADSGAQDDPAKDPHVQGILRAADQAAADGDFQRALMLTGPLVTDYPGTALATDVSSKRSRWQSQFDRQDTIKNARATLDRARSLLDLNQPAEAQRTLSQLTADMRAVVSTEAGELQQQIAAAIKAADDEEKQKQSRAEAQTLLETATAQEQQSKLPEALATYKTIQNRFNQSLWPAGVDINARIAALERRIASRKPPVDSGTTAPPPVDPQQTRAANLWREVQKLDGEKKYEESLAKAEELQGMPSKYRPGELEEKITYLKKRIELKRKYDFFNLD